MLYYYYYYYYLLPLLLLDAPMTTYTATTRCPDYYLLTLLLPDAPTTSYYHRYSLPGTDIGLWVLYSECGQCVGDILLLRLTSPARVGALPSYYD